MSTREQYADELAEGEEQLQGVEPVALRGTRLPGFVSGQELANRWAEHTVEDKKRALKRFGMSVVEMEHLVSRVRSDE